jgi:flagellar motor switch protein FliG
MSVELSGATLAALLVVHLDEETGVDIFRRLSIEEIQAIAEASHALSAASLEQAETALIAYLHDMGHEQIALREGAGFVHKLVRESLSPDAARTVFGVEKSLLEETMTATEPQMIANILEQEHPQTIAVALAHIPAETAARILEVLPEEVQPDVIMRLCRMDAVSPEVTRILEQALVTELKADQSAGASQELGGTKTVADILNQLDKGLEEHLIQQLEFASEELAEEVRTQMFIFDDLIFINDRGIQTLLKEVDRETLMLAVKAADEQVREHLFKNLSTRAVEMILDDMEARGPVRLSEVEKSQAEIVAVALRLSTSGAIQMSKGSGDEFV